MLLLNPFRFVGGSTTTPSIGTITPISQNDATDQGSYTFGTHNSSSGDILVIFAYRSNSGTTPTVSEVKWNNNLLTQIEFAKINGVNRGAVYAGYIRNSSTSTRNLVITLSAATARDLSGYIIDLSDLAASPIGAKKSVVTNINQFSQAITLSGIQNAASRLIAAFFAHDATVDPLTQSAGWTDNGEVQSGTSTTDIVGQLTSKIAGSGDSTIVQVVTDSANITVSSTVKRADVIADAIGINVHLEYTGTVYDTEWTTIIRPRLAELGTRHIRGGRGGKSRARYQDLKSSFGIDLLLINTKTGDNYAPATSYILANLDHVVAVEMLNEPDVFDNSPADTWKSVLRDRTIAFYNDIRSQASLKHIRILHSPLGHANNLDWLIANFSDIGDYCDVRSMHDYCNDASGKAIPETVTDNQGGGWTGFGKYYTLTQLDDLYGDLVGSNKPVWSTEIGPKGTVIDYAKNPFTADSHHHMPIGSGATYANTSDAAYVDLQRADGFVSLNSNNGYGKNVFQAKLSDPLKTITWNGQENGYGLGETGPANPGNIHFPANALITAITGSPIDRGIAIIDPDGVTVYELRGYNNTPATPQASGLRMYDANSRGYDLGSARYGFSASGVGNLFGLLRGFEFNDTATIIRHVLQLALSYNADTEWTQDHGGPILQGDYISPANGVDSRCNTDVDSCTGNVKYGSRWAIPPESKGGPDLDSLGLTAREMQLAICLRDFGTIVIDGTDSAAMRCDQGWNSGVLVAVRDAMRELWPRLRRITNSTVITGDVIGGGTTIGGVNSALVEDNEAQAAKAVVRHLLMRVLEWGYERLYFYQLIENSADEEFGLLKRTDGTPKQAFHALRNIIAIFKDAGDVHNTYDLSYSTSGTTADMQEYVVQKRDGRWYYIIWRGIGDGNKEFLETEGTRVSVTLNVTGITEAKRYEPTLATDMTAALKQTYTSPTAITFSVPDHPVIIELTGAIYAGSTDDWAAVALELLPS